MPNETSTIAELSSRGWVSLQRFAKIVGMSYPTALKLKNEGKVKTVKVGSTFRVYSDEVRRFLEEGNLTEEVQVGKSEFRILDRGE